MKRAVRRALVVALTLAGALVAVSAPARAQLRTTGFAPLDRPGPALTVARSKLAAALECHGSLTNGTGEPVLLNPATGVTPEQNYSWNYERAFNAQGRAWCAVTMPYSTLGDIQIAGEYLVYAIRHMHAAAHRRIAILGHSQGGMSMRWALRFWPDTRAMVDDVIGMAGTNHGTTRAACVAGVTRCPPATWQQADDARFIQALNSRAETFAGISYTEIYTHTDEVVQPNSSNANSSSSLHTGAGAITNVAIQSVCPLDVQSHLFIGTVDPTAYALVMDALRHRGPARPGRIDRSVCLRLYQPGVNPLNVDTLIQPLEAIPTLFSTPIPGVVLIDVPAPKHEPALRCYVFAAGC
jgi:hypothetical protein